MKKLLSLFFFLTIVSCSKKANEISMLDKCIASNISALKDLSIENAAIDNLYFYVPEGMNHIGGIIKTKKEFNNLNLKALDLIDGSRVMQMCKTINPEPKLSSKQKCINEVDEFMKDSPYTDMINLTMQSMELMEILDCNSKSDFVKQEPVVVENCLEKSESNLIDLYSDSIQDAINIGLGDKLTLGYMRKELIKEGIPIEEWRKSNLTYTYEHYDEIFTREARLICNAQGIY